MRIVVDTREQLPLRFSADIPVEVDTLPVGDYSIRGLEKIVAVERKSLSDLIGTISTGFTESKTAKYGRFERELISLRGYRYKALLIEASLADVMQEVWTVTIPKSKIRNAHVLGMLASWGANYGVHVILADNRDWAAFWIEKTFLALSRAFQKELRGISE